MRILGLEISRARKRALSPIYPSNLWRNVFSSVLEPFTGAWQQNVSLEIPSLLAFSPVYCCVTGIASDIAKLRIKLCEDKDGIWVEITENSPWLKLLRKPNHYQITLKFVEQWILCKLLAGNAYVLKERDNRGVVNALYVLDPTRVETLISDSGDIFYRLMQDKLSHVQQEQGVVVPASEIIHDSMPCLFHPLIGTPPLYACAMSTGMGTAIQANSQKFFANRSFPGGILTAPGRITDETALRMKTAFETNFGGDNIGRLLVAGDGLDYKLMSMTAEQSDLVEQLKWSVGDVARAFHYPEYKLGGPLPPYSGNMQALTLSYYTDCLQTLIEAMEGSLDDGLSLPLDKGTELDTDNLLRMDTTSLYESNNKAVGGGWMSPDEARSRANLPAVEGGDTPYLQQQNYSLSALSKRDKAPDPFGKATPAPATPPQPAPPAREESEPIDQFLIEFEVRSAMVLP